MFRRIVSGATLLGFRNALSHLLAGQVPLLYDYHTMASPS